jgi:hypothetical protein
VGAEPIAVRFAERALRMASWFQKGPSFTEASEISFDRSGRYRALIGNDEPVEGVLEVPDDVHNGMTGMLLRNLIVGASANGHVVIRRGNVREGPDLADRVVGPALVSRTLSGHPPRARRSISISTSRL